MVTQISQVSQNVSRVVRDLRTNNLSGLVLLARALATGEATVIL